ncbi:MAG TPA: bifunctional helix-turn-helix transcriptional regulator/GNAT family N-acetyltransferase [Acetobacteraceae bacterium]|jgi:DNA-binding MarR family transcriptional regulator/predicted GNAT family acetyltransferase|nr:bifunctional helix-turn-helix transcriptional regulator/GNAT family N-acetyltransferase [Acetobacteraceae bacterium]
MDHLAPDSAPDNVMEHRIAAVRRFSRFYTGVIGALQEGLLQSRFSLTEARVLYELANREAITASALGRDLGLDAGYLSRILQRFSQERLLAREVSEADRRQSMLALTDAGHAAFAPLDARSREEVGGLLATLPAQAQAEVVGAMARIEALLGGMPAPEWRLREPLAGDIGWVVARHGSLYASEYGFDARFEALVAKVAGGFLASHDPARERCWIAEQDGVNLGSVFLVRVDDELARLRLLLVEPSARGLGIGKRLVAECIAFARAAGYRRMTLWTNDVLLAARGIYKAAGFTLVASKPHSDFGPACIGEDWEMAL